MEVCKMKDVIVYSSDSCIYCKDAKSYLESKGIDFKEKNVSTDMIARKELISQGFMGVPVIIIDGEIIQGFDKDRIDELLE
jgi:glutaredoxin-like YruB-family protein